MQNCFCLHWGFSTLFPWNSFPCVMKFIAHAWMRHSVKLVIIPIKCFITVTSLLCHRCKRPMWKSSQLMYLFFGEAPDGYELWLSANMVSIFKSIGKCILDLEYFLCPKLCMDGIYSYLNQDDQDGLGCSWYLVVDMSFHCPDITDKQTLYWH